MQIHWNKLFALILAVALLVLFRGSLATFLGSINDIGPGHSAHQQTLALVASLICSVLLFVALRTLFNNRKH